MAERHIDHLVVPVRDLDGVAGRFEEAGYVVTPRADHPFGTSNRLVVFDDTYLEFVTVTRADLIPADGFGAAVATFLDDGGVGASHVVIAGDDPESDHRVLSDLGLADGGIGGFSRAAPLPNGEVIQASFSMIFTLPGGGLSTFVCYHHTPRAVWHPSSRNHPNGTRRIVGAALPGPIPAAVAALGGLRDVEFGAATTHLTVDGSAATVRLPGFTVGTAGAG